LDQRRTAKTIRERVAAAGSHATLPPNEGPFGNNHISLIQLPNTGNSITCEKLQTGRFSITSNNWEPGMPNRIGPLRIVAVSAFILGRLDN
jgi:hypothetical protein